MNVEINWVNEFNLPEGYIFKDENDNVINATKIVVEKNKKEYPKTYDGCAKELGYNQLGLLINFQVDKEVVHGKENKVGER